jgi:hypothetical protein
MVAISNIIGVISIILLIYWVFTNSLVEIFQLKVFRQNITQAFGYSVMGILALMFGVLMVNKIIVLMLSEQSRYGKIGS